MRLPLLIAASLIALNSFIAPALAQVDEARIEQLERDVLLLQRKQGRAGSGDNAGGVSSAQTDVRISALEEELRTLRGKVEEREFENKRLTEELEKFKRDTEFRFSEISGSPAPAAPHEAPVNSAPIGEKNSDKLDMSVKNVPAKPAANETPDLKPQTSAGDGVLKPPSDTPPNNGEFSTPRDHYNYAFRLLNQNQYEDAAKSFAYFSQKYPKDPLVGNAYYWQGETHYIRKDYVSAADLFRQGFETMPKGPKAGDNLLKLGMSLSALKKTEEACVVLRQVANKFKAGSANVAAKAESEAKRIGCE